jgi:hypothetical protein
LILAVPNFFTGEFRGYRAIREDLLLANWQNSIASKCLQLL